MNTKKMLAVFAVLCMVSTALACVACTEVSVAAKPIVSDETVKLDADKDFDSNSEELAKLGITSSRYWTFDKEQKMYRLVLDNVNFETSSNIGLRTGRSSGWRKCAGRQLVSFVRGGYWVSKVQTRWPLGAGRGFALALRV